MTVKERLKMFVHYIKISEDRFTDNVGLSRGWVSKDRDTIRKKSLDQIKDKYPEVNTDWLKTGKEEMLIGISRIVSLINSVSENINGEFNLPGDNPVKSHTKADFEFLLQEIKRLNDEISVLKNMNDNSFIEQLMENHRIQYDKLRFENTSLQKQVAILQERYHNEEARRDKEKNSRSG